MTGWCGDRWRLVPAVVKDGDEAAWEQAEADTNQQKQGALRAINQSINRSISQ
jgi:hypothetical protein